MPDFSLLLVSALFFLALSSGLYVGAWGIATAVLRAGRARRISHAATKRVLLAALVLPPLAAAMTTLGGATLRHLHDAARMGHHSPGCQVLFARLFAVESGPGGALARDVLGVLVNGAAWLLAGVGVVLAVRLFVATARLERGLTRFQGAPSPRLAGALARIGARFPGLPVGRFFECSIPATHSSVLGFWRARCVVSRAFIADASDDELDALIAHEASHLRAGDVRVTFLIGALNCFFFYLRPVRLLGRRWREAAELACDDQAVAATRKPLAMASAILRVNGALPPQNSVSGTPRRNSLPAVALPFADQAACSPRKRVERLLDWAEHALLPAAPPASGGAERLQAVGGWALTFALAGIGAGALLSPSTVCLAHCSLEAIARTLP